MANTIVEAFGPSGLTLTLELYPFGSDTIANGAGDTLTEATNRHGLYTTTVTETLSGWHTAVIVDGSNNLIANYAVHLADDTNTYRCQEYTASEGDWIDGGRLDAILDARASQTSVDTIDGTVDSILVDTGTTLPATLATIAGYIDTEVAAIKAVTDNLPDSGALTSLATAAALATVDTNVDAILVDTGTTLPSTLTTIDGKVDTVDTNVDTLLTRITSTLFSGITSLAQWLGLLAGKQTGDATARMELRATGAGSGGYDETDDSLEAIRDRGDAAWTTATGFSTPSQVNDEMVDVLNVDTLVAGVTIAEALRRIGTITSGEVSNAGTGTETFTPWDSGTETIVIVVDGAGNRTSVTYN